MPRDYYKGVTIQYKGDATQLSKVLAQMNGEMRQSQGAARALDAALRLDPKSLVLVKDRTAEVEKQIKLTTDRVAALKSALETAKDPEVIERITRNADIAEARLKSLREQLVRLNTQSAMGADSGLGKVATDAQNVGKALTTIGDSVASTGDKLTMGLTVPMAAFATAAVGAAMSVDTALTDVRKTVDGTAEDYARLKDAAIEYSKVNGVRPEDVLLAQSLGAQLGYARDELEMIGRVATGMDIATDMDVEQATTDMAQFANITKMAHDQTENYASTVVALGNNTATTESKISSMAQRIAAAGSDMGMSESEILGLAAALSSVGMEADAGGSAISTIISKIDKDVASNSQSLQTWAATAGMSAEQFATVWRTSPVEALSALLTNMDKATDEGGNLSVMLDELGVSSLRQTDAMKRLANNSSLLADTVSLANDAWRENTALSEEVANKNDSIAAKLQMAQNRVTAIMEKIGGPLADALIDVLDAAQPLFDAIESGARAFSDMDEGEQRVVITTLALVAALGPIASITGRVDGVLGGMATTFRNVAQGAITFTEAMQAGFTAMESLELVSEGLSTTLATTLVGAGIAAAIVAIGVLVSKFSEWREHAELVEKATTGLADAAQRSSDAITQTAEQTATAAQSFAEVNDSANEALKSVGDFADKITSTMGDLDTNAAMVERYADIMDELGGNGQITAEKLAELRNAVDEYNALTGAAVEITNEQTGALNLNKTAIDEVTEAYRNQAEQKAYADLYNDAVKQQAEVERELAQVTDELNNMTSTYGVSLGDLGTLMLWNVNEARELEARQSELSQSSAALGDSIDYWRNMLDSTPATFSSLQTAMAAAGVTGAQYDSLTKAQLAEIAAAFDGTIASIAGVLAKFGVSVGGAGNVAVNQARKAANSVANIASNGANQVLGTQSKAANAVRSAQQKAFSREESDLRKQNSKRLAAMRESHQAEQKELRKALDAQLKERQKQLDDEVKAEEKANQKRLKSLKAEQEEATKVFRKETDKRLAEMEREYNAQVQRVENDDETSEIDARIAELNAEAKAEQDAQRRKEEREKTAELRANVRNAKSRRTRAEAQKELDDYLAQLAQERRDRERDAEIQSLEDQKDVIEEQKQLAKDRIRDQYEAEKEKYQEQRAEKLERMQSEQDEDYERLQEQLSANVEAHRESNQQILDNLRESNQARLDEMSAAHKQAEDNLSESLDAQLQAMRDTHQAALDEMQSAGSGAVGVVGNAADEIEKLVDEKAAKIADKVKTGAETTTGNLVQKIREANTLVRKPTEGVASAMLDSLNPLRKKVPETGEQAAKGFNDALRDAEPDTRTFAQQLYDAAWEPTSALADEYGRLGEDAGNNLASGLDSGYSSVQSAADSLGYAQESADRSGDSEDWGFDLGNNLSAGIWRAYDSVMDSVEAMAKGVQSILGHSIAKKGPLSVGGRGEAVWGADLVDNFLSGMQSRERALEAQSERMARIVEASFMPSLSARYDASLNAQQSAQSQQFAQVAALMQVQSKRELPPLKIEMHLDGLSLDSTTDIRAASRALAQYTAHEIAAKLG